MVYYLEPVTARKNKRNIKEEFIPSCEFFAEETLILILPKRWWITQQCFILLISSLSQTAKAEIDCFSYLCYTRQIALTQAVKAVSWAHSQALTCVCVLFSYIYFFFFSFFVLGADFQELSS